MCDFQRDPRTLPPLAEDEYVVDSERVRRFIAGVRELTGR